LGITNSVMFALRRYGIEETDRKKLCSFIGPPLVESFETYYGFPRERGYEATGYFQEYFAQKGIFENRLYPGIPEMLRNLREKGFQILLCTSKPEEFATRILSHFHLDPYFDRVCGATMDERERSSKKDVIRYALEKSGIDPKESVMIGDRALDVLGARAFGIATVGVLYGFGSREEMIACGADRLAKSVPELQHILIEETL